MTPAQVVIWLAMLGVGYMIGKYVGLMLQKVKDPLERALILTTTIVAALILAMIFSN